MDRVVVNPARGARGRRAGRRRGELAEKRAIVVVLVFWREEERSRKAIEFFFLQERRKRDLAESMKEDKSRVEFETLPCLSQQFDAQSDR